MPKMVTADITFQRDKSGVMLDTWNHYLNKDDRGCVLGTLRRGLLRLDSTTHQKISTLLTTNVPYVIFR